MKGEAPLTAIHQRATSILLGLVLVALVTLIAMQASGVRGGPLDPPTGPGETDGVLQPGTPISSIPYTIDEPGHYYVTRNLTMTEAGIGITIDSPGVTLDLGGFTLDGANQGSDGVRILAATHQDITVRNGHATRWTGNGFYLTAIGVLGEDLHASGNGNGIVVVLGNLTRCTASGSTQTGITGNTSSISECQARDGAIGFDLTGSTLRDSVASSNTAEGVLANQSVVSRCVSRFNFFGMRLVGGSTISQNSIHASDADGIRVGGVGSLIVDNTLSANGLAGQYSGIFLQGDYNRIVRNTTSFAPGGITTIAGADFNTIDDNSILGNSVVGLRVLGAKNTVIRNSSLGNGTSPVINYDIGPGNNAGPIVAAEFATNPLSNTQ